MPPVKDLTQEERDKLSQWVEHQLMVSSDTEARRRSVVVGPVSDTAIAPVARRCYNLVREFVDVIGAPAEAIVAEVEGAVEDEQRVPQTVAISEVPAGAVIKQYEVQVADLLYGPVGREGLAKLYGHIICKQRQLPSFDLLRLWECPQTRTLYKTRETIIHPPENAA